MNEINQKTIIFSPRYSQDSRVLRKSADELGWSTIRLTFGFNPDELDVDGEVVVYCEDYFAEILADQFSFYLLKPKNDLLPRLDDEYTKRNIELVTYAEFQMPDERKFIKPADFKFFPARIYEPDESLPGKTGMEPEDPILISEIVEFVDEFRYSLLNPARDSLFQENDTEKAFKCIKSNDFQCKYRNLHSASSICLTVLMRLRTCEFFRETD